MKKSGKTGILLLCFLLALSGLTSCKSTLVPALLAAEEAKKVYELDLDAAYDEENGFHYPSVLWGMNMSEAQKALNYKIGKMNAYDQNDVIYYTAYLSNSLNGRKNDDSGVTAKNDVPYVISLVFDNQEPEIGELPQGELYDGYFLTLTQKFGEPDDVVEDERTIENITTHYLTCCWNRTAADGKETQLQWAKATTGNASEPAYITLGFVWVMPELTEAETGESE